MAATTALPVKASLGGPRELEINDLPYLLEKVEIEENLDDDTYRYEVVSVDDGASEADEDFRTAFKSLQELEQDQSAQTQTLQIPRSTVVKQPEVVDDFIRNYLVHKGLKKTFDTFQNEWYELERKGILKPEDRTPVPDVYVKNQVLENENHYLRRELDRFKGATTQAKDVHVRLRKERDFHRLQHRRLAQEKNRLLTDIKRMKEHYSTFEPTLRRMKEKYESAMREKMLGEIEREKFSAHLSASTRDRKGTDMSMNEPSAPNSGTNPRQVTEQRLNSSKQQDVTLRSGKAHPNDTEFPSDSRINPLLSQVKSSPAFLVRSGGPRTTNSFKAHDFSIAALALHPRKRVLVTCSDDRTWRMWTLPAGELVMTGEGHKDWVSSADFHPSGAKLATTSGDWTVKIWDFAQAQCVHTFGDHGAAVWDCSWHWCGDFVASASHDCTAKLWDLNSLRCRNTLRGHADSVNSVQFLAYSNIALTASADKTLSLWDVRNGLCAQTLIGHLHSCNEAVFNLQGTLVASADSFGVIKVWDIRQVRQIHEFDLGPHAANTLTFDPASKFICVASADGQVKTISLERRETQAVAGHDPAAQAVVLDNNGDYMVTAGDDGVVKVWA